MGQYYKPICLDNELQEQWVYSHDYANGLKLMEHSYISNNFVGIVERLLSVGNLWYMKPLVWAGDYADIDKFQLHNLYEQCDEYNQFKNEKGLEAFNPRYIINHTKKEFVDKYKTPKDNHGWRVHPLPLLTCEGNGRGGGDYRLDNPNIGRWARDVISVSKTKPKEKDLVELVPNFLMD